MLTCLHRLNCIKPLEDPSLHDGKLAEYQTSWSGRRGRAPEGIFYYQCKYPESQARMPDHLANMILISPVVFNPNAIDFPLVNELDRPEIDEWLDVQYWMRRHANVAHGRGCIICLIDQGSLGNANTVWDCTQHIFPYPTLTKENMIEQIGSPRIADGNCFHCGAPHILCPQRGTPGRWEDPAFCPTRDIAYPIMYYIMNNRALRRYVFHVMRIEEPLDVKELLRWCGVGITFLGQRSSNLFKLYWVVYRMWKGYRDATYRFWPEDL